MSEKPNAPKWYHRGWSLVISFLCIGPFMLPLVWTHPRLSKELKLIISLVVVAATLLLSVFLAKSIKTIASYYQAAY